MNTVAANGFSRWENTSDDIAEEQSADLARVDQMGLAQQERLSKNYMLVCLINAGTPTREAITRAGLSITESAARKLYKRFERSGISGILDRRFGREKKRKQLVLTTNIKKRILAWFFARPAAGPKAIWKEITKECLENNERVPGYDCVKKYIRSLPEAYELFRKGKIGVHDWERSFRPVIRFNLATYSNQRWQIDNTRLDISVRVLREGVWVASQAHLCACICEHSRSIPGIFLSARDPDAWTTSLLIMNAVTKKENPDWKNKGCLVSCSPIAVRHS